MVELNKNVTININGNVINSFNGKVIKNTAKLEDLGILQQTFKHNIICGADIVDSFWASNKIIFFNQ